MMLASTSFDLATSLRLPDWGLMWLLAVGIYAGCKWLTWLSAPRAEAPAWKSAVYLFGWAGMNAKEFLYGRPLASPTAGEWIRGWTATLGGAALLLATGASALAPHDLIRGWLGMIGIAWMLHFGTIQILSCVWRTAGIAATPIMNRPLASRGLEEFWSRRWNLAFRDLMRQFVFRPLSSRLGAGWAAAAAFVASGLIHDAVISGSAQAGYGLPTAYFVIQAAGVALERSSLGRRAGLGRGRRGRLFAIAFVLLPAPLLFHPPFVHRIVVPFLQAIVY